MHHRNSTLWWIIMWEYTDYRLHLHHLTYVWMKIEWIERMCSGATVQSFVNKSRYWRWCPNVGVTDNQEKPSNWRETLICMRWTSALSSLSVSISLAQKHTHTPIIFLFASNIQQSLYHSCMIGDASFDKVSRAPLYDQLNAIQHITMGTGKEFFSLSLTHLHATKRAWHQMNF